jgi:C1A family cysteine protease
MQRTNLVLLATVAVIAILCVVSTNAAAVDEWNAWKAKYNKTYATMEEELHRFKVYQQNVIRAAELQKRDKHAIFKPNVYGDLTPEEFKVRHSAEEYFRKDLELRKTAKNLFHVNDTLKAMAPSAIDWRVRGAVTGIKNQGQCGSCWSFSTTGNIEGQWFLSGHPLTSLSEQELVSCDSSDSGCGGGLPSNAFTWLIDTQGGRIVTEASYPYTAGNGYAAPCSGVGSQYGAQIAGFNYVTQSEAGIIAYTAQYGPVSIGVDAETWQNYYGGIMTSCYGTQLDHAVLVVGYDLSSNPPYYIVKNQWGTSWGEGGYIRLAYGSDQCGITQDPTCAYV